VGATPAVELSWTRAPGAETCIDQASLVDQVDRTLGRSAFVATGRGDSVLRGRVGPGPHGRGWLAVVEVRREGETTFRRELALNAADCRRLDEAIVLVVAMLVDSAKSEAPLSVPEPPEEVGVGIGPEVAIAYGLLPGVATGFGLGADVKVPPLWPIAVWTHGWPMSQAMDPTSSYGGRLWAWTFGAAACPLEVGAAEWGLYGCAGLTGGSIEAHGENLDFSKSSTQAFLQAELRLGARVRLGGPVFVGLDVGGGIPFTRATYNYTQADGATRTVFQTAAFIPFSRARVEIRVP
jgi:hypothetical protein